jgi:hypothetical protein
VRPLHEYLDRLPVDVDVPARSTIVAYGVNRLQFPRSEVFDRPRLTITKLVTDREGENIPGYS